MENYKDLAYRILSDPDAKEETRSGKTISRFGESLTFDLAEGFPLLTTKYINFDHIKHELKWYLLGTPRIDYLTDNNIRIWNAWRRPYNENRKVIKIKPKEKEDYVYYEGRSNYKHFLKELNETDLKLYKVWQKMMARCYSNETDENISKNYKGKNIFVAEEWHNPLQFIKDAKEIPHWWYKERNWDDFVLDKDYYASNYYSKDTCVWINNRENNTYHSNVIPIKITDNTGATKIYLSFAHAAEVLKVKDQTIIRIADRQEENESIQLRGDNVFLQDYKVERLRNDNSIYRLELIPSNSVGPTYGSSWRNFNSQNLPKGDQIQNAINMIKNNPTSRRIIINGWNPIQLEEMALPPCLVMMQFHVDTDKEKLHLTVTQRSADMCLGVPYDIAEMALLLDLIANITHKTPGKLTMQYGDIHIYEDHIPTLKKQLANKTKPLPRVMYHHLIRDVDDYKPNRYSLYNYPEDLPKYRYKVAV